MILTWSSMSSAAELATVFSATALFVLYLHYRYCFTYWQKKGVPTTGNYSFPLGDLGPAALGKESIFVRIQKLHDQFKARGCRHGGIYFFNGPVYFPIDPDLIKRVLITDFDHFVDRGFYMDEEKLPLTMHMLNMRGEQWRSVRIKFTPAFTTAKMKSMYNILRGNCDSLIEILEPYAEDGGSEIEIKQKLTRFTTDVIGSAAFGIDCNTQKHPDSEFVKVIDKIFNHAGWKLFALALEEGLQNPGNIIKISHSDKTVEKYFTDLVKKTVEYRDKNGVVRDDFLNVLMQLRDTSGMSLKEIVAQSFLLFTAGYETSSSTISFAVHELSYDQELQDRLREEIHRELGQDSSKYTYDGIMGLQLLDRVIKETLRKYPATSNLNRICIKPYRVPETDVVIDEGTPVVVSLLGLHRSPDYFPDPLKFDPERFNGKNKIVPYTYLPFGDGPRNCIGLKFGLMQSKLGLAALINHFRFLPSDKTPREISVDPSTTTIVLNVKGGIHTRIVKV